VSNILYMASLDGKPVSISHATTTELLSIPGIRIRELVDKLEKWSPIAVRHPLEGKLQIRILGWRTKLKRPWITSPVVEINFHQNSIITRSGNFYKLGTRDNMTLDDELRRHLVSALAGWGLADIAERSF